MKENLILEDKNRSSSEFKNSLEELLREGARRLLSLCHKGLGRTDI
ncbi:hypothetical protein [Candidatus Protochlamydia phocaeensis]|nr:hypothetical protein [Candidatus Protochlamydia phocaeensis]